MAKTEQHVHKFRRHTYKSGNTVYFCALPDCNIKIAPALALGKRGICWRCGQEFILSEYAIRLAKPHCDACHKPKNNVIPIERAVEEIKQNAQPTVARNVVNDLKSRLTGVIHGNLVAQPDEEDI